MFEVCVRNLYMNDNPRWKGDLEGVTGPAVNSKDAFVSWSGFGAPQTVSVRIQRTYANDA